MNNSKIFKTMILVFILGYNVALAVANPAAGLAKKLNREIFGQEETTRVLEEDFKNYFSNPLHRQNHFVEILASFPGLGKTSLVTKSAELLGLPLIRINLQAYAGTSTQSTLMLGQMLYGQINQIKSGNPDQKFILMFENLNRLSEVASNDVELTRPALALVNDLLDHGSANVVVNSKDGTKIETINIKNAMVFVTLNVGTRDYDFSADPLSITHEEVMTYWNDITKTVQDLRVILSGYFLPDTINLLLSSRFHFLKPLTVKHYQKILKKELNQILQDTKNVKVFLSERYQNYLLREAVIPTEGGRLAAKTLALYLKNDIQSALSLLKQQKSNSAQSSKNAKIWLDFSSSGEATEQSNGNEGPQVLIHGQSSQEKKVLLQTRLVKLRFPAMKAEKKIELNEKKLDYKRIHTAVHEFGHAYTAIRLGSRIKYASVLAGESNLEGSVEFINKYSAQDYISRIFIVLGSRAMERILMSKDPISKGSVLAITDSASSDIGDATWRLWAFMYAYGFDPQGGTVDRSGLNGNKPNSEDREHFFENLSESRVEQLGLMLRDLEDFWVGSLLAAHSLEWYKEKIIRFAQAGSLDEKQFYELLGYPYPGTNEESVGVEDQIYHHFKPWLKTKPKELKASVRFKQGDTQTTAAENLKTAVDFFQKTLKNRFHSLHVTKSCEELIHKPKK